MKEINGEIKSFITTYMAMAKENESKKEELDNLIAEVEEIYQADREAERKRLEGIKKASGIELPPDPKVKDPRYAAKMRQKEDMQAEYDKKVKALKQTVLTQKNDLEARRKQKEAELKEFETKYLANAKKALELEEKKMELGGSPEQMALFEADHRIAEEAVKTLKGKSDAICEEIDHLRYFEQTIKDLENGKYDFEKLEKAIEKLGSLRTIADAKKAMKDATVAPKKEKPGAEPPKPGAEPPKPGAEPPKPGAEPPKPGAEPPKPGAEPPKPGAEPPKPGAEPPKPGTEPKPEGTITAIRYSALENTYELTFENGAKMTCNVDKGAIRDFRKQDKRYLKELIPGFGAYKRCDMGLFKALRDIDRKQGTHNFEEYIKVLNGEKSAIENITYDAEKMNDPSAFQNQETVTRTVMTRMMRKVRRIEGIDVVGFKRTRRQRFVDFFLGGNRPKQITEPQETKLVEHDDPIEPTGVEEHPIVEEHEEPIQPTTVAEHEMTAEEAKKLREAVGGRRSQKGKDWAAALHVEGEPEEHEYTVDEIIAEEKARREQRRAAGLPEEESEYTAEQILAEERAKRQKGDEEEQK